MRAFLKGGFSLVLVDELERISGYNFTNEEIAIQALTHSSFAKTHHIQHYDNERLEFLGDAVLELSVSNYLFFNNPLLNEGEMTRTRSLLVREESLFNAAMKIGLNKIIRIDEAEEKIGGREKPSIVSDAYEAVIAAIYIDGGFSEADRFIERTLLSELTQKDMIPVKDPKSLLQEYVQANNKTAQIKYVLLDAAGPDHKKIFKIGVCIDEICFGEGTGFSKRDAGEKAAQSALEKLCGNLDKNETF